MLKQAIYLFMFTSTVVLSVGCNDSSTNDRCLVSSDCPLPLICYGAVESTETETARSGRCIQECRLDSDCMEGLCIDSVCRTPEGSCRTNADCVEFGRTCDPGTRRCVAPCGPNSSCPQGTRCVNEQCQSTGMAADANRPQPVTDARITRDRGQARDATSRPLDAQSQPRDAAVPMPDRAIPSAPDMGMVNRGNGQYGDNCRCGAECNSGLCVPNPYRQFAGECSQLCGQGNGCPSSASCIQVSVPGPSQNCPPAGLPFAEGEIISVCAVNETGIPCQSGENCAIGGVCYPPPNPVVGQVQVQAACAAACTQNNECPVGFSCQRIPTDGGQFINICAPEAQVFQCPDGSNQSCGDVCPIGPADDELNISHCIVLAPNQPGYCSCSCNSAAQCPAGYACSRNVIDTQDPRRPGICLPISGYTCPLGNESCLSQGCAGQLDAELISRCTAPCSNLNDCPTGYRCMGIPGEDGTYCVANP
ncbi:MAG: hypothetical protein CMH52_03715 [Myxococcales bacterium]|nr:hypothetical protein [Myxococcales bacterium]